ncbi:MAG: MlaD family protein [Planctomycetes bacterium]|nr:MlaD family protein [Planctomycetota bacterium]
MDVKPHYFRIGLFVLAAVILIVVVIVLFGVGLFAQNTLRVESYFAESITGLSVGSPVEFRGVRIGQVEEIGFVGDTYPLDLNTLSGIRYSSWVRVVSGILRSKSPERDTLGIEALLERMVARGLRARVSSNLLTQQAFLELNLLDPNRFPVEKIAWVPKYTVIPSAPSEFTTLKGSIDKILSQLQEINAKGLANSLEKLFTSLNTAITEANIAQLSRDAQGLLRAGQQKLEALDVNQVNASAQQFLASLNQAVEETDLPQLGRQARELLTQTDRKISALDAKKINDDIERLLTDLNRAVVGANVPAISRRVQAFVAELQTTNKYLQALLKPPEGVSPPPNVPEAVARLNQTLSHFNGLIATEQPAVERVLNDLRDLADSLKELISNLEQNPSALLFSKPPKRPEVLK